MVAVLNNYGGFYQRRVYVNEAKKTGGNICLPCVNKGGYQTSIEDKDIYLGFDCLLNLENSLAQRISEERRRNGNYTGLENFILRTGAGLEQVVLLIRCGAFRFTGTGKKELLWEAHLLLSKVKKQSADVLFERVIDCSEQIFGLSKLVKIDKLKKTTVQTSFTRNEPIDVDSILQNQSDYEYTVQRQSVSKNNFDTKLLPALESYGEGILFVLDKAKLEKWELQQEVIGRTEKIKSNAHNADWKSHQIIAKTLTPRKVLIHTLSHLLMRELEYVCGYPVASLSERLYVSETMHGFLISAFDGTDGYLGGLSNLCNDLDNLNNIINSAIFRATDCSSDPICIESEGQGVGQLNLAACHSCTLTPEITCELSNLYLDRNLIVNKDYGYYKSAIE
jgi:hypothetical protein